MCVWHTGTTSLWYSDHLWSMRVHLFHTYYRQPPNDSQWPLLPGTHTCALLSHSATGLLCDQQNAAEVMAAASSWTHLAFSPLLGGRGQALGRQKFLGQGLNPYHSSDLSHYNDNAVSLTLYHLLLEATSSWETHLWPPADPPTSVEPSDDSSPGWHLDCHLPESLSQDHPVKLLSATVRCQKWDAKASTY